MKNQFEVEITGLSNFVKKDGSNVAILTSLKQSHFDKLKGGKFKDGEDTVILYYAQSISNLIAGYLESNHTIITTSDEVFVIGAALDYLNANSTGALVVISTEGSKSIYKNFMFEMPRTQWVVLNDIETLSKEDFTQLSKYITATKNDLTAQIKDLREEQGESDANADEIAKLMEERSKLGSILTDKFITSSTLARIACRVAGQLCVMNISSGIDKVNRNACIDAINLQYPTIAYDLLQSAEKGEYIYTPIEKDKSLINLLQKTSSTVLDAKMCNEVYAPTEYIADLIFKGTADENDKSKVEAYETVPVLNMDLIDQSILAKQSKGGKPSTKKEVFVPSKTVLSSTVHPFTADNENVFGAPIRLTIGISADEEEDTDIDEDIEISLPMYTQSSLVDLLTRKMNGFFNNKAMVATYVNDSVGSGVEATQILMEVIDSRRAENLNSKAVVFYSNGGTEEDDELLQQLKEYPEIMVVNPTVMSKFYIKETKDSLGNTLPNSFSETNIDFMIMSEICDSLNVNTATNKVPSDLVNMFILAGKPTGVTKKNKNNIYEPVKSQLTIPRIEAKIATEPKAYMTTMNMYPYAKEKLTREVCLKVLDAEFESIDNGHIPTKAELNPNGIIKPEKTDKKTKSVKAFGEE